MDIYYHKFSLTPRQSLNRLSSATTRDGVFLRSDYSFWEYFPHPELGDKSLGQFLSEFSEQNDVASQKALHVLSTPFPRKLTSRVFQNHHLWQGENEVYFPVVKYKLKNPHDTTFFEFKCDQLRLDANGLFTPDEWDDFEKNLPDGLRDKIDYIEDPLSTLDWSGIKMRCARDFIHGTPSTFTIYKPYREFYPNSPRVIFSGNMGHALAQYLSYVELMEQGQLSLVHGLINPPLYENVPMLFKGDHYRGFYLDVEKATNFLGELDNLEWKKLCSI